MKILHFADLHLGVENYSSGIDSGSGLPTRLHDFLGVFDEVVDYAINSEVDLVLFCGDAYKSREPSQTHQREFASRIWKLASAGIHVFLVVGNHDLPNAMGHATTMEIFRTLDIDNVTVAGRMDTYRVETKAGTVQIIALPWVRRNAILARDEAKELTSSGVNERIEHIITEQLNHQISGLDPQLPAIFAGHICLSNATFGSERGMIMGQDHVMLLSSVARQEFDYVALGHIHKKQVLSENPPVVYPGSLQRIDFGEERDDKGFYIVDIDNGRHVSYEFRPVKARRFQTIAVEIEPGETGPSDAVLRAISCFDIDDAIVRVQISVPEQLEHMISDSAIRKALKGAYHVAATARDVKRERHMRMPMESAESLEPLEALRAYLSTKKARIDVDTLLQYGERLIHEGEGEIESPAI